MKKTKMYKAKQKNAFTLIELLAIIVILAIIAIITVPIVLNIIDNSKKGAVKSSAYGYKEAINKYYLEKLSEDKNYTIQDKNYDVTELKSMGVTVNGEEPLENSWVEIKKNIIVSGCLQYDEYKIEIINGEVTNAVKDYCNAPDPVSFKTDSWKTIKRAINEDNTSMYKVGDTKEIVINDISYTVRLSNKTFDGCDTEENGYSQSACGFVFEFVDIIENYNMNWGFGNSGSWPRSAICYHLNYSGNNIYDKLPNDLKSVIADTYIVTGYGKEDASKEENFESTNKLYLLSMQEVLGNNSSNDTARDYTRQLEYYKTNNKAADRVKSLKSDPSTPSIWWLRTPLTWVISFWGIDVDGQTYIGGPTSKYGISPTFRIVKD